jgi:PAS domain S-box-containing protein
MRARGQSASVDGTDSRLSQYAWLAWLPIPLVATALAALWVAGVQVVWPLPPVNWLVHYGGAALGVVFIAIPAARGFLASGQPSVLMLGCGVLMMDVAVVTMPSAFARSSDIAFAIYNSSALLGALCHFLGVAITSRGKSRVRGRAARLVAVYCGGMAAMGLVIWAAFAGWMPVFFIDGQGGTVLRSLVVGAAVALFALTAAFLWQANRRAASSFSFWYALGLLLLAAGLAGSMAIAVRNSPLQWVARLTQVLGTIYMCVAALTSARASSARGFALAALEESWWEDEFLARVRQRTPAGWLLRYGLAAGATAAALGFRALFTRWVGPDVPTYITFYPAVMIVAVLAGFWPGLLATAMADAVIGYWVLPPVGQFVIATSADRLGLVVFTGMGVFMSAMAEVYRRNRDKAAVYDREAAFRESRERLAAFAEATFEGIAESEAGRIVDCNEQFAQMTGYAAAELKGMEIVSLIPVEERDRVTANIQRSRDSLIEHTVSRKDGTRIVVEAHGRPVGPDGVRRHTAIRDITERKRGEVALRRYELLAGHSRDIVLFMRRDDGRILEANAAAETAYGYSREEMLSLSIRDLRASETRPLTEDQMALADTSGLLFETVHRRKDGSTFPVEVSSRGATIEGARTLMSVVRDITERKKTEEALRQNEERYRGFFDNLSEAVVVLDAVRDERGEIVDWRCAASNDAHRLLLGPGQKTPVGTLMSEGMGRAEFEQLHPRNCRVLATGETVVAENNVRGRILASTVFRIDSETLAVTALDITERRRAEDALREADRRKDEFLAVLSHELRNPLAPIRNSLHILGRAAPGGDQARRAQTIIERQVGQLAHLVDDLLDVTRISRNKIRLERQVLEVNDLVRRTIEDYRSLFEKNEVGVEAKLAHEPIRVNADGTRLAQVVGNLLQNAAKFTGRGGQTTVSVCVAQAQQQAVISVSDTGVGMPPDVLARLFQPFMQADTTLDRSKGGLGLGLALVKGLVELHGGTISARSEGLGKGAEFIVRLPLVLEAGEAAEARPASAKPAGRRVLIIEDNIDAADSLRDVLEFGDHVVEVAYHGPEGLARAREFKPEVVLCDIGLPGMDGYQVARALRADDALKEVFLVALSGYALPEDLQRAHEAGFDRHLAKPPSIEKIEEALASARSP